MDDVHRRLGSRANDAISGEQVEIAHLPRRLADEPQPFGSSAQENVAADAVAAEQPRAGLAHRVEPLQAHLQPKRDLLGARVLLRILGQQQAGFEVGEPGRHHEIIGRDLELQRSRLAEIGEILLDQLEDRDLREIDLLRARQAQQQVERPFPAVEVERQLIRLPDRPLVELLFHATIIPRAGGCAKATPHDIGDN